MNRPNSENSMRKNKNPLSAGMLVKLRSGSEHNHADSFFQTEEDKLANVNIFNKILQEVCQTYQKQGHFCQYGCVFCISYPVFQRHRHENELVSADVTPWNETNVVSLQLVIPDSVSLAEVCSRKAALIICPDGYAGGGGNNYSNLPYRLGSPHNLCMKPAYPKQICIAKKSFSFALSVVNWSECFIWTFANFTFLLIGLGVEGQRAPEVLEGEVRLKPWRTVASGDPRYAGAATSLGSMNFCSLCPILVGGLGGGVEASSSCTEKFKSTS
ncbi:MAG: hypothetical protein KIH08_14720 [Candidatus Freyarchaeota archaeon]|nr:hypothetical protein [Candidatus Jordarchaeia archaeon]MBS7270440.1 hypothetical protein [Candidatus Jordarchaeia archaeon]MBS7279685.1 hypothetical protein [Candidatus Jordarchaeia archaeon]